MRYVHYLNTELTSSIAHTQSRYIMYSEAVHLFETSPSSSQQLKQSAVLLSYLSSYPKVRNVVIVNDIA